MHDNERSYKVSLGKHLAKVPRQDRGQLHNHTIITLLERLPAALAAREPLEAVCVTGLKSYADLASLRVRIGVRLLVQSGWDMELSMLMYRNFMFLQPKPRYPVETLRLMTRTQLIEEYGPTYGDVIADVCTNPSLQPIFAALFFGDLDREVVRPMRHIVVHFLVDEKALLYMDSRWAQKAEIAFDAIEECGGPSAGAVAGAPPRIVPYSEAAELYKENTGEEPRFTFSINPREIDYARQAAQEEIRQTRDRERVQRERSEVRNRFV